MYWNIINYFSNCCNYNSYKKLMNKAVYMKCPKCGKEIFTFVSPPMECDCDKKDNK